MYVWWGAGVGAGHRSKLDLTSSYRPHASNLSRKETFVENELRDKDFHKQNSPLKLVLRVYISEGKSGGLVAVLL